MAGTDNPIRRGSTPGPSIARVGKGYVIATRTHAAAGREGHPDGSVPRVTEMFLGLRAEDLDRRDRYADVSAVEVVGRS